MFWEIVSVIGLLIFAVDSLFFIGLYGKIETLSDRLNDFISNFDEDDNEEDEQDKEIRERITKTLYA